MVRWLWRTPDPIIIKKEFNLRQLFSTFTHQNRRVPPPEAGYESLRGHPQAFNPHLRPPSGQLPRVMTPPSSSPYAYTRTTPTYTDSQIGSVRSYSSGTSDSLRGKPPPSPGFRSKKEIVPPFRKDTQILNGYDTTISYRL